MHGLAYSGFGSYNILVYSGFSLYSILVYLRFCLYRILFYSGFSLYRIRFYSGFSLYRIPFYSGFGLYRLSAYSGFGLERCHCISKQLWTRCLSLKLMTKTITKLMKTRCKFNSEQVSDCSLMQSEECFSYIMARASYIQGDENMVMSFCTRSTRLVRFLSC